MHEVAVVSEEVDGDVAQTRYTCYDARMPDLRPNYVGLASGISPEDYVSPEDRSNLPGRKVRCATRKS